MRERHELSEIRCSFKDWSHKKNTAALRQKLYLKGRMPRNEEEETAAEIQRERVREKESGGLELDEGHISSH